MYGIASRTGDKLAAVHRMKTTMIEFPLEQYYAFLNTRKVFSQEYSTLLRGVIVRRPNADHYERVMEVLCKIDEAGTLLQLAKRVYPDAVPAIEKAISAANRK